VAKRSGNRPTATKGRAAAPVPKVSAALEGGVEGANRRERKEEARRQREALMRKIQRRKMLRIWGLSGVAAAVVVALVLFLLLKPGGSSTAGRTAWPATLPGEITSTDTGQWTANTQDLAARISALGLPPLTASEQLKFHIHQHIDIFVDGQAVTVPALIGLDQANGQVSVIHVHQVDGIIHVESGIQRDYRLGDFFGVWGLRFSPTCLGGYCDGGGKTLRVYVNGAQVTGDPRNVVLKSHEEIVVTFGAAAELPTSIPSSFTFPQGD
jgi:hypothetical protein